MQSVIFYIKLIILHFSKAIGIFKLSKSLTRNGLRILCYHGIAFQDEHLFQPKLFITSKRLQVRFEYLINNNFTILSLEKALIKLEQGQLPKNAIVITIDDGFYGIFHFFNQTQNYLNIPITIYLTSYYSKKNSPVFGLAVQYMFWKTNKEIINMSDLNVNLVGLHSLATNSQKKEVTEKVIAYGEKLGDEQLRIELSQDLAQLLNVDYSALVKQRVLSVINESEVKQLHRQGFDIQLHTHRHRIPFDKISLKKEIDDNKEVLESYGLADPIHFCYPSGEWDKKIWPYLEQFGITTAVTCDPGLNYENTPRLGLKRFLDSENISQIVFEAEVSGFMELIRKLRMRINMFIPR